MIKRFKESCGKNITRLIGQDRLGFAMTGSSDLDDLVEWAKRGGYQGSNILFFDFENGNVYKPFKKRRDVLYTDPAFSNGYYYILQGDYNDKKLRLYRYIPEQLLEQVTELDLEGLELYNLGIIGNGVHIISQYNEFVSYYPESFSFPLQPNETVTLIDDGKVYIEAWIEEGWDEENDCATDKYEYYNKIIIKDFFGNTLFEETGALYQGQDGTWWIA